MDILSALESETPAATNRRCVIGRWLDDIPDDTAGKSELAATLETSDQASEHWRTLDQLDALVARLGLHTSIKSLGDHRSGKRCRCHH